MILFHVHDARVRPPPRRPLSEGWTALALPLDDLDGVAASAAEHLLFDVDLVHLGTALRIRAFMARTRPRGLRIFACRRGSRHAAIQAGALGATNLVGTPLRDEALADLLPPEGRSSTVTAPSPSAIMVTAALDAAFRSLGDGKDLQTESLTGATRELAAELAEVGIEDWLLPIRTHHTGTYQHCLTVMGFATAFGQELGLSADDLSDLSLAALLHDIGKARISRDLLDKPTGLTPQERAIFERHPVWGHEFLLARSDVSHRIAGVVRHHHEYLDGSGYPDGVSGRGIDDLTRLVTIADIFSALVEERAYKAGMPAERAFAVLTEMTAARLERPLVKAFEPVAAKVARTEGPSLACYG